VLHCLRTTGEAGFILHDIFLCDFTLMWHKNLHHFFNLRDYFWSNAIWHRRSMAALVLCWRLAESDVTVMLSVTCMDLLCWWYNCLAGVVSPSTALGFVNKMSEELQSTSPSEVQVKNQWKAISIEEKLDVISRLEKGERIVDICHNVIRL
jgi:hypothetical protein